MSYEGAKGSLPPLNTCIYIIPEAREQFILALAHRRHSGLTTHIYVIPDTREHSVCLFHLPIGEFQL